jgi:hypothetical protein
MSTTAGSGSDVPLGQISAQCLTSGRMLREAPGEIYDQPW